MGRLEPRWQQRWETRVGLPARTVRFEETLDLRHPPPVVWALVATLEQAPTLSPDTVARAFPVPGTPDGVGQQQCLIAPDGALSLYEVVELLEPHRAVVRPLSPAPPFPVRGTHDLRPSSTGCLLTVGLELDLPQDTRMPHAAEADCRRDVRDYLQRVSTALDGVPPEDRADPSDDAWAVPLDDDFVALATVREQPGDVRAAAARRITAGHSRAQPWRAPVRSAPVRQRRSHLRAVAAGLTAVAVTGVVLLGADQLQQRHPDAAVFAAGRSGGPVVPRPPDAQDTRLAPPVAPPAGEGGWRPLAEHAGRPVGFDPCRPVHWVMRPDGAPADALGLLDEAFARLSEATGLVFVYDGPTDEAYDEDRPPVQPERYGDRYAPVLVVWSDPQETGGLDGDVGGFAGATTLDPDGAGPRQLTGVVVLDTPQLSALPEGRLARLGVVLHELGHLAGLDHVEDTADSMYESSGPAAGYTAGTLRGLAAVGNAPCFPG